MVISGGEHIYIVLTLSRWNPTWLWNTVWSPSQNFTFTMATGKSISEISHQSAWNYLVNNKFHVDSIDQDDKQRWEDQFTKIFCSKIVHNCRNWPANTCVPVQWLLDKSRISYRVLNENVQPQYTTLLADIFYIMDNENWNGIHLPPQESHILQILIKVSSKDKSPWHISEK